MKMLRSLLIAFTLGVVLFPLAYTMEQVSDSFDWATSTKNDITFITKTLLENHPGACNQDDFEFIKVLTDAGQIARANALGVKNIQDHITLLRKYTSSFNDTHLGIQAKNFALPVRIDAQRKKTFSIKEISHDTVWIELPTFDPDQIQKEQLIEIINKLPGYRLYNKIIFDVRGNSGGASMWGENIIKALFGQDYAEQKNRALNAHVCVDWRASIENTYYVETLIDHLAREFGENSEAHQWILRIHNGMKNALESEAAYFSEESAINLDTTETKNLCNAHIFVMINQACVSACLDFIDFLKVLDNPVTLVGQPTKADSMYMEIRRVELPSKLGNLVYPIKMYKNRKRGHNQPYYPDILYEGSLKTNEQDFEGELSEIFARLVSTASVTR